MLEDSPAYVAAITTFTACKAFTPLTGQKERQPVRSSRATPTHHAGRLSWARRAPAPPPGPHRPPLEPPSFPRSLCQSQGNALRSSVRSTDLAVPAPWSATCARSCPGAHRQSRSTTSRLDGSTCARIRRISIDSLDSLDRACSRACRAASAPHRPPASAGAYLEFCAPFLDSASTQTRRASRSAAFAHSAPPAIPSRFSRKSRQSMRRARAHRFRATARPSAYDAPTSKSSFVLLSGTAWVVE